MAASASAVTEGSSGNSRKRNRPAWSTIASAVSIAVVVILFQFDEIRSYVNVTVTGKSRTKGRSSSSSGRQMSNNRQGHSSGAGENADSSNATHYTRIMYESEMNAVIRNILAPANEEFGQYQQPGYSQGLSMMNREMLRGLKRQVEAVVDAGIDGDVYEFGSWRGGASILMARVFNAYERYRIGGEGSSSNSSSNDVAPFDENYQTKRMFYVFDTFDGFLDQQVSNDTLLQELLLDKYWVAPLDNVRRSFINLTSQGFVDSNVRFMPGLFEDTVPSFASSGGPNQSIALLRLDGDLYESTRVVLEHMFDDVAVGGHVIVDDYDWRPEKWAKGGVRNETTAIRKICKEAVDEYRLEHSIQSPITREYARPSWTKEAG